MDVGGDWTEARGLVFTNMESGSYVIGIVHYSWNLFVVDVGFLSDQDY